MRTRVEPGVAGVAGVVGLALTVVGGTLAGEFDTDSVFDAAVVAAEYSGASADRVFAAGVVLETVGFLLLLVFLTGLARAVGDRGDAAGGRAGGASWPGRVVEVAGAVAVVLTLVSVASFGAATFRAGQGDLVGDGIVVLSDLRFAAYWVSLPVWALVYLAAGAAFVLVRSFPAWLGWPALGIGAAHLVVPFLPPATWDVATGAGGLWMLGAALLLLARRERSTTTPPVAATAAGH